MSIYIKGMEMPTSCRECSAEKECASDFYCGYLGVDADTTCFDDERRENCPLIPVPDHGRFVNNHTMQNCGSPVTKMYCEDYAPDECDKCPNWTPKKLQTNADYIRAMSDEELAEAIDSDFNNIPWCDNECSDKCIECIIKWLKEKRDC